MTFVAAKCPQCAGALQVPDDRDIVKCMYCGIDVIVRQAIQLAAGNTRHFQELAEAALARLSQLALEIDFFRGVRLSNSQ